MHWLPALALSPNRTLFPDLGVILLEIGKSLCHRQNSSGGSVGSGINTTEATGQDVRHIRPLHPPFTHFPIAAYVFAAGFDVISVIGGNRHPWAAQLWHAATFVLIAGLAICLLTMLTGFADLIRFDEQRPEAVRTMAVHVCIQATVFMIGVGDVALRVSDSNRLSTPPIAAILTVAAAVGVCTGGLFGGTLVYRHGTGVAVTPPPTIVAGQPAGPANRAGSARRLRGG